MVKRLERKLGHTADQSRITNGLLCLSKEDIHHFRRGCVGVPQQNIVVAPSARSAAVAVEESRYLGLERGAHARFDNAAIVVAGQAAPPHHQASMSLLA